MPLQNRVTPEGALIRTDARGSLMGNRGVLHDDQQEIVRQRRGIAWITCLLEFKGRTRELMQPGHYTELFFLDEATALAAGHRPCGECRHARLEQFLEAWVAAGHARSKPKVGEVDQVLDAARITRDGEEGKVTFVAEAEDLPDGTFIRVADEPWLIHKGVMNEWSPEGYRARKPLPHGEVEVLTPEPVVAVLRAGFVPEVAEPGRPGAPKQDQDELEDEVEGQPAG
jgi:hypothetical protein